MSSIIATFLASAKSVGTACTMAMVGVYLHQRGFIDSPGKRTLALISQQVTFPLFLFTKIIYCNQDWSPEPCPDVTATLEHGWLLLFWPLYVVTAGLVIGQIMAKISGTPKVQYKSVWAAVAFGNSTGLPITLLTVVHENFPPTSDLGVIDPTLFLSVYLLLYPVLQWGMGGWLLAPIDCDKETEKDLDKSQPGISNDGEQPTYYHSIRDTIATNVLNHPKAVTYFDRKRLPSNDEGIYLSQVDLANAYSNEVNDESSESQNSLTCEPVGLDYAKQDQEDQPLLPMVGPEVQSYQTPSVSSSPNKKPRSCYSEDILSTLKHVSDRCLQPPVVGALLGIIVAIIHPLRGTLVDIVDRGSHAPLEWIFDGLYSVGRAAVPINMIILGCNLSNSYNQYTGKTKLSSKAGLFSKQTLVGILVGKMLVMPVVGILSAIFLRLFVLDIPDEMDASFYLVLMIVFLTVRNHFLLFTSFSMTSQISLHVVLPSVYQSSKSFDH